MPLKSKTKEPWESITDFSLLGIIHGLGSHNVSCSLTQQEQK